MVVRRIAKGASRAAFDRISSQESLPTALERFPSASSVRRFFPRWWNDRPKIEFWAEEGVIEICDPRLFRDGGESFRVALVGTMVRLGMARRVEIRRSSATCRIEFEPGRFDRDDLSRNVARSLKAASLASQGLPPILPNDRDPGQWITLTALASTAGPSIWETRVDGKRRQVHQSQTTSPLLTISAFSRRPIRNLPRRVRTSPPKARPAITFQDGRAMEPVALAVSPASIFGGSSSHAIQAFGAGRSATDSKRMLNLALAGGSFAMAVAGVVLPGIPALPFLILTGRYLVKSLPELCLKMENVPAIGTWLLKATETGSQVVDRRSLLKMFGLTVAAVATFAILHPPLPIVILLEVGILAYYGFRQWRRPSRTPLRSIPGAGMPALA